MTIFDALLRRSDHVKIIDIIREVNEEWPIYVWNWLKSKKLDERAKQSKSGNDELNQTITARVGKFRLKNGDDNELIHISHEG